MAEFGAALTSLSFLPGLERSSVPNDRWSQPNATTLTGIGTPPTGVAPGTLSDGPPARSRTTRVTAVLSGWSMYFVESSVGQLDVTTVFAQEASPKKLKAVHSRHGYLQMQVGRFISEPSVSQNYGDCEIQ